MPLLEFILITGGAILLYFHMKQCIRPRANYLLTYEPISNTNNENLPKYEDIENSETSNLINQPTRDQNTNTVILESPPNYSQVDRRNSI